MSDFLSLHVLPLAWQGFLLVVLALTAAVLAAVRARIRSQLAAAALAYLTTSAATLVAGAADEVRQLKDPDKPGTWDTAAQQRILGRVVRDLWAIGGRSIEQLRAVQRLDQDSVQRLLVQLSEAQVEALRQRSVMTAAMAEPHATFDPTVTVNAPRSSLVPDPIAPRGAPGFVTPAALVVVCLIGAVLALGALLSGCPDTQHDAARYGTVKVYVAPEWIAYDRARIGDELAQLAALGPAFVITDDAFTADVVVRPWESPDCARRGGRFVVGSRVAEVDPVCAMGDDAFKAFVGHEIGHVLGMLHICREATDGADCSPTITGHPALMNPSPFEDSRDDLAGLIATDRPTALDLAEYRRVRGAL